MECLGLLSPQIQYQRTGVPVIQCVMVAVVSACMRCMQIHEQKRTAASNVTAVLLLVGHRLKALTVGARRHRRVRLVSADSDGFERAVVFAVVVVFTAGYVADNALVGIIVICHMITSCLVFVLHVGLCTFCAEKNNI